MKPVSSLPSVSRLEQSSRFRRREIQEQLIISFLMIQDMNTNSTQTQPLMGMPATGKKICVTAMNIYEFKDGKIIREHGLPDMFSLLMQLGVIPAPGQ